MMLGVLTRVDWSHCLGLAAAWYVFANTGSSNTDIVYNQTARSQGYYRADLGDKVGYGACIGRNCSVLARANAAPWDTQCRLEKQSFMHIIGRANLLSAQGHPLPAADFKRSVANKDDDEPWTPFGYGPGARGLAAPRERCAQCATRDHANAD